MKPKEAVHSRLPFAVTAFASAFFIVSSPCLAQQMPQKLHQHVPAIVSSGRAEFVGKLPATQTVDMTIVLPVRSQPGLTSLVKELYDPSSPKYRHFLSVQEFTDQFSATEQDYENVIQWAKDQGFSIESTSTTRLILDVSGTAAQVNAALNVSMNVYRDPNEKRTFYSIDREPTLNVNVPIAHIEGLNNFSIPRPMVRLAKTAGPIANVTGSGPGGYYLGSDMRAVYYGGTLLTGAGQCVGVFEFGGYRLSDVNLDFNNAGQTYSVPINNVLIDGATAAAGSDDSEQVLDIVQAIGMAPGLSQVRVYIGVSGRDADILSSMGAENACKQLAVSWSWSPDDPSTDDQFFQEFAAQGQSIFVASGDDGAYDPAVSPYFYPAEDAYVTAVGGTNLTTNYGGGPWVGETAWNSPPYGSGGGISPDNILIPSWQQGAATYLNGGSAYLRNVPDVAMEADLDNYYCDLGTCGGGAGGTSFAAVRWAAFMALINEQATETGKAPAGGLGFINPAIYAIGEGPNYTADFHDITSGNNDSDNQPLWFNAITGYDLVTGWGSPNGQNLVNALAGPLVPGFWLADSPASLSVAQGSSVTTTVSVTDTGGFAGNVSLTATGLPSGLTASFNPSTTAGTSVLTLTASSSMNLGPVTLSIAGTSGSLQSKTSLFLTVNPPPAAPPPVGALGSVNVGAASNATAVTLTFTTSGTLGSISVLTQGVANLDFANPGGGSCSIGTAYAANSTCTVNVKFTPQYAGTRYGAVILADASGNQLAKQYLIGTGLGAQATFIPGTQLAIGSGFIYPEAAAALGDGSVYVSDYGNGNGTNALYLEKFSNGTYTQSKVNCTLTTPAGVAVDGSGTIYVADPGGPAVYKVILSSGNCTETKIGSGFGSPWGVAVDGSGDVYVTDLGTSSVAPAVYKETLQTNGNYVQTSVGSGWVTPAAVAVDAEGKVYVADSGIPGAFMETPSGGSYTQTAVGQGWAAPSGVAVDGSGNIYVSDAGNSIVFGGSIPAGIYKEVASGGTYLQTAIGSGWVIPRGIAVDGGGNVYVPDQTRGVFKNDLADPPALAFVSAVAGTTSSDSPKTVTVSNIGTAALQFSSVAYPTDFPEAAGLPTDCTSSSSVGAGASCTLSIEFLPTTALGADTSLALNESVKITTNTLNSAGTQQEVTVSGTEVLATGGVILSVSSNPTAAGTPVTFTASVTGSTGGPTPTGTVTFYNGTTALTGLLTLSNGVATYSTSSLPVGTYAVLASYSGDANYPAAISNTITESIVAPPATSSFGNTSIGTQNVGSTSAVIPLSITFSTAETLGSISVLSEGVPNLDFANAGGGSCSIGTAYAANATCTVNVTFTPQYSGARYGAVVLSDNNGNVIGTGYLEGTGVGPQTVFLPGTLTSIATGFGYPQGAAVDGNANVYIADATNAAVYKETLANGTYTRSTVGSGFSQPHGVAVDAAGNIYVSDAGNHAVYKEAPSNGTYVQTELGSGFISPVGVAVDALGNVYVADFGNGVTPGAVYLETLSNGTYTQSTIGSGFVSPESVAVDGAGNVYVADSANGNGSPAVYELTPSAGSYNQTAIGTGWVTPSCVAVDGNGNVYISDDAYDLGAGFVAKEAPKFDGTLTYYEQSTVLAATSVPYPGGVAVDARGNLYVTDKLDGVLDRDDLADPPTLSFAATTFGSTSSDSPRSVTVQNAGNATLAFSALSYPPDFPEAAGITTDCTSSTSLGAGTACTLSIDFTPASLSGTNQSVLLSENVAITTNSLNAPGTAQAIAVSGTEAAPVAAVVLNVPANVATVGASVTFTGTVTGQNAIATPTGSLTFYANGTALGTLTLNNGAAAYTTNSLAVGVYTVTATYSGDQIYPGSTSSPITEQIIPSSTFGTESIASASPSTPFNITFASAATLGSIAVVTQGMPNLDFTNAGGGTCTVGTAYATGASCTVNVAFKPRFSGVRYGAIVVGNNNGNVIQTILLQGTGTGPQITFSPSSAILIATSSSGFFGGMAVDGSGDIYIDTPGSGSKHGSTNSIVKWTLSGQTYTSTVVPSSTLGIYDDYVAVDGAGNVYIADMYSSKQGFYCRLVKETLVAGSYKESTIIQGGQLPCGTTAWPVAVDGSGNVYILDGPQLLKETPSGSTYTQTTIPTSTLYGFGQQMVAVDGSGNVYLSDLHIDPINRQYLARILKETPGGGSYTETVIASSTTNPYAGPAVDGNENVYFTYNSQIFQAIPSGQGYTTVPIGYVNQQFGAAWTGIAVDGAQNVYTSQESQVAKLDRADPPSVSFEATNVGSTSADSPRLVTLANVGNAALTFPAPSTGTNPSISPNFSLSNVTTCPQISASGQAATLDLNGSCNYAVNFTPTASGTISGSLVVADNALNAVGGTQTIPLSGSGTTGTGGAAIMAVLAIGPGGVPQGVLAPNQSSSGSANYSKVWVDAVHQTLINGYVFLQVNSQGQPTCALYSQANVTAGPGPQFGTLSYSTENYYLGGGQCPGILFPFRVARYTWGPNDSVEQDPFILQVSSQVGNYLNEYGFTADFAQITMTPAVPSGSGSNPPLTATASLTNPPFFAEGYTWTIIGGGGAIVFPNGQQKMSSTTNSITIVEPNPTPGTKVPFKLTVAVTVPYGRGPLTYGPADEVFWNVPEITVIAWVNANAPDITSTVDTGPSTADLKTKLNGLFTCPVILYDWKIGERVDLNTSQDSAYADAWLLQHSGNPAPPSSIDPSDQLAAGNYRLFNNFGSGPHLTNVGKTPPPCTLISWYDAKGEPSPYMGASDVTANGNTYQLAEGRVGTDGQIINMTINQLTTPWIWSVVEFDSSGNPSWNDHAMFPTYSVYINGQLNVTIPQSAAQTFINQGGTYQRKPSEIQ